MRLLLLLLIPLSVFACRRGASPETAEGLAPATEPVRSIGLSDSGQQRIEGIYHAYLRLSGALVEADSLAADSAARGLQALADGTGHRQLGIDSLKAAEVVRLLGDLSAEAAGLAGEKGLAGKRRSFSMLGEQMLSVLKAAGYDRETVYRQTCPMAFNDNETAHWLSSSREIVNPYLGRKHPRYGAGMLHCGELTDSLHSVK